MSDKSYAHNERVAAEALEAVEKIQAAQPSFNLEVGDNPYTVVITDGVDAGLVSIRDSRDNAATVRLMVRMPDLLENPQLLSDMLADDTGVAADDVSGLDVVAVGAYPPTARPGFRLGDVHGNEYVVAYTTDSNDRYIPCLILTEIAPSFALKVFMPYLRSSAKAILDANARVAAHGTHLRSAKSEAAKLDRESRIKEAAARDLVESLSVTLAYHKAKGDMHKRQASLLKHVLTQYASEEAWTGDAEGSKNKLTSNIDGFSVAKAVLQDVAVAEID